MKRSVSGSIIVLAAMCVTFAGLGCSGGGAPASQPAAGLSDESASPDAENDDGFFVIQWTLKIGHIYRKSVHPPLATTAPSTPVPAK